MTTLSYRARVYTRETRYFLVRDEASNDQERSIDFHVTIGDCFATLATITGLLEESLAESREKSEAPDALAIATLKQVKKDLLYLDRAYKIVSK